MLTKKQNAIETIKGGNPDRFVNQYEYLSFMGFMNPINMQGEYPQLGGMAKNAWGVTIQWPEGLPGMFPVHDDEHKVVKDITQWRKTVKAPKTKFDESEWKPFTDPDAPQSMFGVPIPPLDRNEVFAAAMMAPGVFEQLHYLMGMDDALLNFYEAPSDMKDLIAYITEYELSVAEELIKHFHPDAIFHHDDWGSYRSSFISPAMFDEFIAPAYKQIYGYWKANGAELVVHHSDSYAANLVPSMIEVGIDVFQGCVTPNDVPALVKKYGPQISFMGDLDNGVLDKENWSREEIAQHVRRACETNGKLYFIPCLAAGGPGSTYPGVYEAITEEIDKMSKEMF